MSFKLPDTYYDPPTYYFFFCADCTWESGAYDSKRQAIDETPSVCPQCGSAEIILDNE